MTSQQKIKHLIWRAGFGPDFSWWTANKNKTVSEVVDSIFEDSKKDEPIALVADHLDRSDYRLKMANPTLRKEKRRELRDDDRDLNVAWLTKMVQDKAQLREKMTFFWGGHFSTRNLFPDYAQRMNNMLRKNAFGDFKTLVTEVAQQPAMLLFLSNQQNVKEHPNENFARELMELFTIGRGNYTEQDVKESARAFTGWKFDADGNFFFNQRVHDSGTKTFMGKTGNFDGYDIINIILERKETAVFISRKLYKFFVNDSLMNDDHVQELAETFYSSGYKIETVLRKLFTSDWFYDDSNAGAHIKSPIELIAGLQRTFPVSFNNPDRLLTLQRVMGQTLFYPPNVAGWPGGKNWIDSSSLMFRLKLASNILNSGTIDLDGKEDVLEETFSQSQMLREETMTEKKFDTIMEWGTFNNYFSGTEGRKLRDEIASFLLTSELSDGKMAALFDENDVSARAIALKIVSLPEYQLS